MAIHLRDADTPILLFDGVCNLCNGAVQWVIRWDRSREFKFASLQSEFAAQIISSHSEQLAGIDSVVLLEGNKLLVKSEAALGVCRRLGGWFRLVLILGLIPTGLRDKLYDWIAAHRYAWFGKTESCMLPDPDLAHRFLE